jgi:ketosteroid isomerase-like protein
MDRNEQTRDIVRQYYDSLIERDWNAFLALLTENLRYEMPQTSERITGKETSRDSLRVR